MIPPPFTVAASRVHISATAPSNIYSPVKSQDQGHILANRTSTTPANNSHHHISTTSPHVEIVFLSTPHTAFFICTFHCHTTLQPQSYLIDRFPGSNQKLHTLYQDDLSVPGNVNGENVSICQCRIPHLSNQNMDSDYWKQSQHHVVYKHNIPLVAVEYNSLLEL